jgi:hypothetical protein
MWKPRGIVPNRYTVPVLRARVNYRCYLSAISLGAVATRCVTRPAAKPDCDRGARASSVVVDFSSIFRRERGRARFEDRLERPNCGSSGRGSRCAAKDRG